MTAVNIIGSDRGKNYIINGGMRIGQRGNVPSTNNTLKYGGADRWAVAPFLTTSTGTITQQAFSTGTYFAAQALFITSSTGAGTIKFMTRLEARNVYRLNGKQITVSFRCFQNTGAAINLTANLVSPVLVDNYAGAVTVHSPVFSVPNAVESRFTFTFTMGPTDCTNGLELNFNYAIAGALTSKNFYISDVQLEEGPVATPLETMSWGEELILCQRYFEKSFDHATPPGASSISNRTFKLGSVVGNGTYWGPSVAFAVNKRASPIVTLYSPDGSSPRLNLNGTNQVATATQQGTTGFSILNSSGSSLGAEGQDASFHFTAEAEL